MQLRQLTMAQLKALGLKIGERNRLVVRPSMTARGFGLVWR